jgi:hypothetical protein
LTIKRIRLKIPAAPSATRLKFVAVSELRGGSFQRNSFNSFLFLSSPLAGEDYG